MPDIRVAQPDPLVTDCTGSSILMLMTWVTTLLFRGLEYHGVLNIAIPIFLVILSANEGLCLFISG